MRIQKKNINNGLCAVHDKKQKSDTVDNAILQDKMQHLSII